MRSNGLEGHRAIVNVALLQWKETVHMMSRLQVLGSVVCEATSVVCGVAVMGAWLDLA